jgi:diadenosine tetraphosphate (Ap4A) HIT family hydrolase
MKSCRFCELEPGKNKVVELFKYCYVMFANPRIVPGQLLIIPNRHVERISELNPEELHELMHAVNSYCTKILKFSQGYFIKNNYMPFIEENEHKVNHLHIHIVPRNCDDELFLKTHESEISLFKPLSEEEYKSIIEKLDE